MRALVLGLLHSPVSLEWVPAAQFLADTLPVLLKWDWEVAW